MRVVVHHPARTEPDGTEVPESVSAYKEGRIHGFSNPLTGEWTDPEDVARAYIEQAKAEFPGLEVKVERLIHNGDAEGDDPYGLGGTGTWVAEHEVPEGAISPKGGVINRELRVTQDTHADKPREDA